MQPEACWGTNNKDQQPLLLDSTHAPHNIPPESPLCAWHCISLLPTGPLVYRSSRMRAVRGGASQEEADEDSDDDNNASDGATVKPSAAAADYCSNLADLVSDLSIDCPLFNDGRRDGVEHVLESGWEEERSGACPFNAERAHGSCALDCSQAASKQIASKCDYPADLLEHEKDAHSNNLKDCWDYKTVDGHCRSSWNSLRPAQSQMEQAKRSELLRLEPKSFTRNIGPNIALGMKPCSAETETSSDGSDSDDSILERGLATKSKSNGNKSAPYTKQSLRREAAHGAVHHAADAVVQSSELHLVCVTDNDYLAWPASGVLAPAPNMPRQRNSSSLSSNDPSLPSTSSSASTPSPQSWPLSSDPSLSSGSPPGEDFSSRNSPSTSDNERENSLDEWENLEDILNQSSGQPLGDDFIELKNRLIQGGEAVLNNMTSSHSGDTQVLPVPDHMAGCILPDTYYSHASPPPQPLQHISPVVVYQTPSAVLLPVNITVPAPRLILPKPEQSPVRPRPVQQQSATHRVLLRLDEDKKGAWHDEIMRKDVHDLKKLDKEQNNELLNQAITDTSTNLERLFELVERLVHLGLAEVFTRENAQGNIALEVAAYENKDLVVGYVAEAMVRVGAEKSINRKVDGDGNTLIHILCEWGDEYADVVSALLQVVGAEGNLVFDVNIRNYSDGMTPLHILARARNENDRGVKMLGVLLDHGADQLRQDLSGGRIPLVFAIETKNWPLVWKMVLLEGNPTALLSVKDYQECTALHHASQVKGVDGDVYQSVLQFLMDHNADPVAQAMHNILPKTLASASHKKIFERAKGLRKKSK